MFGWSVSSVRRKAESVRRTSVVRFEGALRKRTLEGWRRFVSGSNLVVAVGGFFVSNANRVEKSK